MLIYQAVCWFLFAILSVYRVMERAGVPRGHGMKLSDQIAAEHKAVLVKSSLRPTGPSRDSKCPSTSLPVGLNRVSILPFAQMGYY